MFLFFPTTKYNIHHFVLNSMSVFTQISGTRMRGKNVIMDNFETKLISPDNFPFPFSPYSIQRDFMKNLYECLEGRKLGIFESPTGTVSTLKGCLMLKVQIKV